MDNKWRNWCRTNLGLETAPIKNFVSKTRFVSLGSYCALPSIAGKLQIEVTLHGARDLPIFTWPIVTANGVIVTRLFCEWWYFCYLEELFMPHALIPDACNKQPEEKDFRTCPSECSETREWPWYFRLRRRSPSFAMPRISWRSRSFRLDEDPVRSSDLEQLKWLYRMTQTKIKVEAISLVHDTWNRIILLCGPYDDHFCTRIACVFDQETSSNRTCKPFSSLRSPVWWRQTLRRPWKSLKFFQDAWTTLRPTVWSISYQTRLANVFMLMTTALLHDNAGFFSYGDAVYPPLRDAHFPDVMGRLPLASWFRWWRGMESMEKHGKLWGCMGRFIRLGKSLAKPGKRDHATAQGALPVSCSSCLAGNQPVQIQQIWIRWIPIFFLLRVFGANLLHCLYFSQNKKRQRENLRLTQNRWQKILASHLPVMPRKTSFSFALLLDFVRFRGLRSCNAYNLWFRMPAAKSNGPTCLRWIAQRSCWRFLTSSKRWNDVLVAPMCDFWCW